MDFRLFYNLGGSKSGFVNAVFYGTWVLLAAVIFCYGVFTYKVYVERQKISQLNGEISAYVTPADKAAEQTVISDKKEIDDFATLIDNHTVVSGVFNFIEQETLPNVWFSNISILETKDEVDLIGQAQDMETLSRQVQAFEQNKNQVENIEVLNSEVSQQGTVDFTLNIALYPAIFSYTNSLSALPQNSPSQTGNNVTPAPSTANNQ